MGLTPTLIVLGIAAVVAVVANIMTRRPHVPGAPRRVPYLGIQFLAILGVVLMLGHLVTLLTGKPFAGRSGF